MTQLLIYNRVVPLNRDAHRDVSVRRISDFGFAAGLNSVPLLDVEFAPAALEYPILFARGGDGAVTPLALLGVTQDHNSFVGADGQWTGRYVPAFLRRYPFVFASDADRFTLCVDDTCAALNSDGEGERLFDSTGQETAYTRTILGFVQEYQQTFLRTQAFAQRLDDLGLLEEARIDFTIAGTRRGEVTGFLRVAADKLRALDDAAVLGLFRTGELDLIQLHLVSLQTIEPVVQKLASAPPDAVTPAPLAPAQQPADVMM